MNDSKQDNNLTTMIVIQKCKKAATERFENALYELYRQTDYEETTEIIESWEATFTSNETALLKLTRSAPSFNEEHQYATWIDYVINAWFRYSELERIEGEEAQLNRIHVEERHEQ